MLERTHSNCKHRDTPMTSDPCRACLVAQRENKNPFTQQEPKDKPLDLKTAGVTFEKVKVLTYTFTVDELHAHDAAVEMRAYKAAARCTVKKIHAIHKQPFLKAAKSLIAYARYLVIEYKL